jgi:hypothetical protein
MFWRNGNREQGGPNGPDATTRLSCGSRTSPGKAPRCSPAPAWARRICRDHRGGAPPSGLSRAARQEPGARRRLRLLVQRAAANRAPPCTSTRTARLLSRPAAPIMAAETWGSTMTGCARSSPTPRRSAIRISPLARASPSPPAWSDRHPHPSSNPAFEARRLVSVSGWRVRLAWLNVPFINRGGLWQGIVLVEEIGQGKGRELGSIGHLLRDQFVDRTLS